MGFLLFSFGVVRPMIGSEKTAGRRQVGKIKKPADFSTEGKTAGRISWRGTTWFRAEAARTHFP
jgi:hypothetical protein